MELLKFLTAMAIILATGNLASNQVLAQQCEGDIQGLMRECAKFVQRSGPKTPPSRGCCDVLKHVDIACACRHVTKDVEQIISMEKVIYVLKGCGRPMHTGARCGSKISLPIRSPLALALSLYLHKLFSLNISGYRVPFA